MASRFLVLGSGELGTACALSLLTNTEIIKSEKNFKESSMITMMARDKEYLHELQYGSRNFRVFDKNICVPEKLNFKSMDSKLIENNIHNDALFLCTPLISFKEEVKNTNVATDSSHLLLEFLRENNDKPTFVFSRGFSRDGLTPCEVLNNLIKPKLSKMVVVSGPLFAKEWALSSIYDNKSDNNNINNGVSLSFAMSDNTEKGILENIQTLTKQLWRRESITWLTEPSSMGILSLVNGCIPLCCMGAGMVSSEYPANVSAMISYMQHSISATEKLVNLILDRPNGMPLPACAVATLAMACTNHSTREFIFGRRLNFYFKHRDAIRAVFPGNSYLLLDEAVAGIHTLLSKKSISSPFYEVLMDSFLTVLRASVAGKGLVKSDYYDYHHNLPIEETPLLRHAMSVDEAVFDGDEKRFDEARRELEIAFSNQSNISSTPS